MTNPSPDIATNVRATEDQPPSTPRWVRAFGIVGVVLVLLFVILKFTSIGSEHGPGRHMPSGSVPTNNETLLASVTEHRLQQL